MPNGEQRKVYVWPLFSRISHWVIVFSFLASFCTSFYHHYFTMHMIFGYLFGATLLCRLLWGFMGPKYALFSHFQFSLASLKAYFREKIANRWRTISPGHNPASSWFTLIVLVLGLIIVLSGMVLYGTQEASGVFAGLNQHYYRLSLVVENIHRLTSYILLLWAIVHIAGVLIEQFYHRTGMVLAMVTGYKRSFGSDTTLSFMQSIVASSLLIFLGVLTWTLMLNDDTILFRSTFEKKDYAHENRAFFEKCATCHKHYPPYMLPQASWEKMMDGLENHFGERIMENNITRAEQHSIRDYLVSHSAEHSSHKLAYKTLISLGEIRPLSITKSPYWRKAHEHLPPTLFQDPLVKDTSNCFACHKNLEYGIFDNRLIHLP